MTHKEMLYQWALRYMAAGWNVLPAARKHPIFPWTEFQRRRASLEEWKVWVDDPNVLFDQLALVTGRLSGVTVVDVDVPKEGQADPHEPQEVCEKIATDRTLVSVTGGGGRHLFYAYRDIPNSVKLAHPQLDTRSEGGIIILPPSRHPSGEEYRWEDVTRFAGAEDLARQGLGLEDFPAFLERALKTRPKRDWARVMKGVSDGSRTATCAQVVGAMLNLLPGSPEVALDLAEFWNRRNRPPLPDAEVRRIYESILRRHVEGNAPRPMGEMGTAEPPTV